MRLISRIASKPVLSLLYLASSFFTNFRRVLNALARFPLRNETPLWAVMSKVICGRVNTREERFTSFFIAMFLTDFAVFTYIELFGSQQALSLRISSDRLRG